MNCEKDISNYRKFFLAQQLYLSVQKDIYCTFEASVGKKIVYFFFEEIHHKEDYFDICRYMKDL